MIRLNRRFIRSLEIFRDGNKMPLAPKLDQIIERGIVPIDGCFLLGESVKGRTNATTKDFPDRTGYECFINHIHVEDYVSDDLVNQTISFARKVLKKWDHQKHGGELNAIIVFDDDSATVRFHLRRPKESWLSEDIDGYKQAVLEISSLDVEFFALF